MLGEVGSALAAALTAEGPAGEEMALRPGAPAPDTAEIWDEVPAVGFFARGLDVAATARAGRAAASGRDCT